MRLMEAARLFVEESGRIKTPASRRSFLKVIGHLNKWADEGDGVTLEELTEQQLTDWCLAPREDGTGPVAPSTIRNRRAHVRSMYSWATWRGYVETDPASQLDWSVSPGTGGVVSHTWLTEEIAKAILDAPFDHPSAERDRVIILLGMMTGLRAGVEMVGLRWDQFNDEMTTLTIVGKGSKLATVGVPDQLRNALIEWKKKNEVDGPYVLPRFRKVWDPAARREAWMTDWDTPVGYDGVLFAVRNVGKRHGIKLRPHDLRRSFASILEGQGVPLNDISIAMRHENVATTSRYLDRNPAKATAVTSGFRIGVG